MITKRLVFTLLIGTLAFTGCSQTKHESTNSLDEPSEVLENTDVQDSGEEEFNFSYECLNTTEFWFGSGAGAWRTTLRIKNDGSFYGEYSDTDAGSISSEAPNGTKYYCAFNGQLGTLEKIDNLTYKTTINSISYENPKDTDEIVDGIHYFYTEPYGLENAGDIYFYLPGKNVNTIDSDEYSWIGKDFYDAPYDTEGWYLPFVVLANSNMHYAFHGYDFVQQTIDACEYYNNDSGLSEEQLYLMWDQYLNEIWVNLHDIKDSTFMNSLKEKELDWISERDSKLEKKDYMAAYSMTKERALLLLDYLIEYSNNNAYPIPLQEDTSDAPHTAINQSSNEHTATIDETPISDNRLSVGDEYVLKSTINIRMQPDSSSDKLAIAYKDEIITIKSEDLNGWTEIEYDGSIGYVRSELLQ
ncbi:SH3 domain-containing protein [Pseudobutyrivibrio sp. LB2011]|uniref:SH3 domain-containing protein n=1 Tax=Pseudobutyrivibrio sp. LB2011 TaxID=1408312 RepID=UPI000678C7DE|nr:SH3 domain-containing protein [Pseudobutyrivibrio sp. LB2011]